MAKQPGKGDIESQLDRLGELLNELTESRREAFFEWIKEGDEAEGHPPGSKSPPPPGSACDPPLQGHVRLVGPRRSTSVAISEPLLAALKEYFTAQGVRLSISALVELLIWQFLGSPTELVEKTPQAYRPRGVNVKDPLDEEFLTSITDQCLNTMLGESPSDKETE